MRDDDARIAADRPRSPHQRRRPLPRGPRASARGHAHRHLAGARPLRPLGQAARAGGGDRRSPVRRPLRRGPPEQARPGRPHGHGPVRAHRIALVARERIVPRAARPGRKSRSRHIRADDPRPSRPPTQRRPAQLVQLAGDRPGCARDRAGGRPHDPPRGRRPADDRDDPPGPRDRRPGADPAPRRALATRGRGRHASHPAGLALQERPRAHGGRPGPGRPHRRRPRTPARHGRIVAGAGPGRGVGRGRGAFRPHHRGPLRLLVRQRLPPPADGGLAMAGPPHLARARRIAGGRRPGQARLALPAARRAPVAGHPGRKPMGRDRGPRRASRPARPRAGPPSCSPRGTRNRHAREAGSTRASGGKRTRRDLPGA